jgi:hypothetical protein
MMANNTTDTRESFVIPSRILRGSRQEMVQDIDQAIVGLLALRHLIGAGEGPAPSLMLKRERTSALHRAWSWLGLPLVKPGKRSDERGSAKAS